MLDKLFSGSLTTLKKLRGAYNDDGVDRLNHSWTVFLLFALSLFVTTTQLVGDPIECWCPAEFKKFWVAYTKAYCWISNTYYIPMDESIPTEIDVRQNAEIKYYQWVPVILIFMALLFKIPNILWRILNDDTGLNFDKIVTMAESTQIGDAKERERKIKHIALYMDRWLDRQHDKGGGKFLAGARQITSKIFFFCCNKREGTYVTGVYLFTKLLYCANVIGQFFLLNKFLAMEFQLYGVEVISYLTSHGTLKGHVQFPRVTLCDFQIRQMQNIQRFTVQCVLPINLFNEKIFAFLWFWLVIIAFLSSVNVLFWVWRIFFPANKIRYIRKYLQFNDDYKKSADRVLAQKFVSQYLRDDGVLVLRVVGNNSTNIVVTDLVYELWKIFKERHSTNKLLNSTMA